MIQSDLLSAAIIPAAPSHRPQPSLPSPSSQHQLRRAGDASSSHISHIFAAEQNVNDNCDPEIRNHRKLDWCGPARWWWRGDIASIISFFKQKTSFLHVQNISLHTKHILSSYISIHSTSATATPGHCCQASSWVVSRCPAAHKAAILPRTQH